MAVGFGFCGIPDLLIEAIRETGVTGLTVISDKRRWERRRHEFRLSIAAICAAVRPFAECVGLRLKR